MQILQAWRHAIFGDVSLTKFGITLAIAVAGGLVAMALHLPAPLLVGGIVTVSVASFFKLDARLPPKLLDVAFIIIGLLIGTNVSSDTLSLIGQWPWSVAGVFFGLFFMICVTMFVLIRFFKLDPMTAYLSSVPGHLSMVMSMAADGHGQIARITTIQSVRLLFLTLAVPIMALVFGLVPETGGIPEASMNILPLLILVGIAVTSGLLLKRIGLPAAMVLGPMVVAMIGKLAGFYAGILPPEIAAIGLVLLGVQIGGRMSGISAKDLKRDLLAGSVMTIFMIGTTALVAFALTFAMDMPLAQIWLGLAPGGLDAIGPLGLALGLDAAFIAAHQMLRLLILGAAIPFGSYIINKFAADAQAD